MAPAAVVERVTSGEDTAWGAVVAYVLVWAPVTSDDVETTMLLPVETAAGFVTVLAVTSTGSPVAMEPQPLESVRMTVSPPLLVVTLDTPHCVPVARSVIVYEPLELKTVPAGAARVIEPSYDTYDSDDDVVNLTL